MLGTNLATRPFYNERAVRVLLAVLLLALVALTVLNGMRGARLRETERVLSARATQALADAERLRADATRLTAQIDPREMAAVAERAREVNAAIGQRVFSWSALLADIEATLPGDVRVLSLQPDVTADGIEVTMSVEARDAGDVAAFMDALDAKGTFHSVLPQAQVPGEDMIEASIRAIYKIPPGGAGPPAGPERTADAPAPSGGDDE